MNPLLNKLIAGVVLPPTVFYNSRGSYGTLDIADKIGIMGIMIAVCFMMLGLFLLMHNKLEAFGDKLCKASMFCVAFVAIYWTCLFAYKMFCQ